MTPTSHTAWFCCLLMLVARVQANDAPLVIATWGGPYEEVQQDVLFSPFTAETNRSIQTQGYFGGLDALRDETTADVFDMLEEEAFFACEEGLLLELDDEQLFEPGIDQALDRPDFLADAIDKCSIAHLTFSTLIAYDARAFPGEKPRRISDLFDLVRFPGKRALKKDPSAILEWALMAEGVPNSQVYDLLSTERGMRIALKRLGTIREQIVWWDEPAEAVALLNREDVVMASGYNGRFFESWRQGSPINLIWHGQIIDRSVWAISAGSKAKSDLAYRFMRFALKSEHQAKIAERIAYGPTRKSAFGFIGLHAESGISMTDHLPTADHHVQHALSRDTRWYARTRDFRYRHFNRWLGQQQVLPD